MAGIHMCNHHVHSPGAGRACIASVYNTLSCRSFTSSIRRTSVRRAQHLREQILTTVPASRRRSVVKVTAAQSQDDGLIALPKQFYLGFASSLGITKDITRTQAYSVWLQGGVVLVILAAIDAGFSGDWSRTGVLSKDAELGIRSLLGLLGLFHIVCGSVTVLDATQKGYNPVPQTLKVLAVGFLATVEQLYKDPAE